MATSIQALGKNNSDDPQVDGHPVISGSRVSEDSSNGDECREDSLPDGDAKIGHLNPNEAQLQKGSSTPRHTNMHIHKLIVVHSL